MKPAVNCAVNSASLVFNRLKGKIIHFCVVSFYPVAVSNVEPVTSFKLVGCQADARNATQAILDLCRYSYDTAYILSIVLSNWQW